MTTKFDPLVCMLLGLVLYVLSLSVQKLAWLQPLGLICFGVGLFQWLPGTHVAYLR